MLSKALYNLTKLSVMITYPFFSFSSGTHLFSQENEKKSFKFAETLRWSKCEQGYYILWWQLSFYALHQGQMSKYMPQRKARSKGYTCKIQYDSVISHANMIILSISKKLFSIWCHCGEYQVNPSYTTTMLTTNGMCTFTWRN